MYANLWVFLSVAVALVIPFLIIVAINAHKTKLKQLEIEALKIKKANIEAAVEDAINRRLGDQLSRIEVLEAIVTDKSYDLNEKITRLK